MDFEKTVSARLGQGVGCLHADGELCDVTVTVGNDQFSCHRVALAAVSDFFRAYFRNEKSSQHVTLDSGVVSPESFTLLMDILYKRKDVVKDTNTAFDLLATAVFLQIDFLQKYCEDFLVSEMKPDTCLNMWQLADAYDLKTLRLGAKNMATKMFEKVMESNSFVQLPLSSLLVLLSSDDLVVVDEDNLCEGILKWVCADEADRTQYLPVLLPFVCFINISDDYTHTLRDASRHFHHIREYLDEAMVYKLEASRSLNSTLKSEILACQERGLPTASFDTLVIAVGACSEHEDIDKCFKCFSVDGGARSSVRLKPVKHLSPLPVEPGTEFASCVWRNELFVSGGSKRRKLFMKYNSGLDTWYRLPDLQENRQGHAMVALSRNIYLLGGMEKKTTMKMKLKKSEREKKKMTTLATISAYCTDTETRSAFGHLTEPRTDVTAAVLGHRIYVFGGNNAEGEPTSLVECVDTLTGSTYQAGRMPCPTSGACAFSDRGSAVYVVLGGGSVYRMNENAALADNREKANKQQRSSDMRVPSFADSCDTNKPVSGLSAPKEGPQNRIAAAFEQTESRTAMEKDSSNGGADKSRDDTNTISVSETQNAEILSSQNTNDELQADCQHNETLFSRNSASSKTSCTELQTARPGSEHDPVPPTVSFCLQRSFRPEERRYRACFYKGNVLVFIEKDSTDVESLPDVQLQPPESSLTPLADITSILKLHTLNFPRTSDKKVFRFTFLPAKLDDETELDSALVWISNFDWGLSVYKHSEGGEDFLAVFFGMDRPTRLRSWSVSTNVLIWLVPARESARVHTHGLSHTFTETELDMYGTATFISLKTLTDPAKGYITDDGEVTLQATVTFTQPPQIVEMTRGT